MSPNVILPIAIRVLQTEKENKDRLAEPEPYNDKDFVKLP